MRRMNMCVWGGVYAFTLEDHLYLFQRFVDVKKVTLKLAALYKGLNFECDALVPSVLDFKCVLYDSILSSGF